MTQFPNIKLIRPNVILQHMELTHNKMGMERTKGESYLPILIAVSLFLGNRVRMEAEPGENLIAIALNQIKSEHPELISQIETVLKQIESDTKVVNGGKTNEQKIKMLRMKFGENFKSNKEIGENFELSSSRIPKINETTVKKIIELLSQKLRL